MRKPPQSQLLWLFRPVTQQMLFGDIDVDRMLMKAKGWGHRMMCTTNKYGFPIKHKTRCQTFFGFKTGNMVQATLPTGKFAGIHVGRLIVRASGVFELISPRGKVSPVRHKYCQAIHLQDGYIAVARVKPSKNAKTHSQQSFEWMTFVSVAGRSPF